MARVESKPAAWERIWSNLQRDTAKMKKVTLPDNLEDVKKILKDAIGQAESASEAGAEVITNRASWNMDDKHKSLKKIAKGGRNGEAWTDNMPTFSGPLAKQWKGLVEHAKEGLYKTTGPSKLFRSWGGIGAATMIISG